jgi:monoterpene epsilon-lactone hydrolase
MFSHSSKTLAIILTLAATMVAQQGTTAAQAPTKDTSYIDADGTAHITRVVPVPPDLSPQARKSMSRPRTDADVPETLEQRRTGTDKWQSGAGEVSRKLYPANVENSTVAGVPVRIVTPLTIPPENRDRVLINFHGGGFDSDSGSLTETIPIANLTKIKVVAVLYRLAPEHPFPAWVDDAIAVYKELLKTYKPEHIGVYGTSAGAILTSQFAVKIRQLNLPQPAALGIFSGLGDFSTDGDSAAMYALGGLSGHLDPPKGNGPGDERYLGKIDLRDPVLSPLFADLKSMPPALFITSGRDLLLSGTVILHRAFLRAGNDAQLIVFEGLPHAFWNNAELPESKETYDYMAKFFTKQLSR